ncbi:MAG: SIS domain-containing protein [Saprospiraceae bacterium]|nr:SIS domain-containing protein [Saprospiraceae bacterium]
MNIQKSIQENIQAKQLMLADDLLLSVLEEAISQVIHAFKNNRKVLFCGNGGSAADAQHLAAELSGRFYLNRPALHAEALHCNTSYLTAVANDYSFDVIYSRLIEGIGQEGDILVAFSTSGNSVNILHAMEAAMQKKMITIGFTGHDGGKMAQHCQYLIPVPAVETPRIQECHMLLGHILCENVEAGLFQ